MDLLLTDHHPDTCSTLGLECGSCMRNAAASVAQICGGLDGRAIQQIFVQLYPSSGCRPMAATFEAEYLALATPLKPVRVIAAAAAAA